MSSNDYRYPASLSKIASGTLEETFDKIHNSIFARIKHPAGYNIIFTILKNLNKDQNRK